MKKRRFKIKSLYIKWVLLFIALISVAQMISFVIVLRYILPDISEQLFYGPHNGDAILQNMAQHGYDPRNIAILTIGIRNANFIATVMGSVFCVAGLYRIIRPIKKVTQAAKEVTKGNFDVELKSNSIDEIGQLINSFNTMTKELEKIEHSRKEFVSNVSHEFKTPITSIEGFAKMLKSDKLTHGQFDEYTDIIIKEAGRLSMLSSNLLKLSMLESTGFEPSKSDFFLDEHIRNIILLLQSQWEDKNIEFDIDMDEVEIISNEEMLSQVWINLIQNAIKFSDAGGVISISLKRSNSDIIVSIKDSGAGIDAASREKIFDRFYKADKSRSDTGNGLGLSIVKKIVEILNGSITCESELGQGTTFILTFPTEG